MASKKICDAWVVVDAGGFVWDVQVYGPNQGKTSKEAHDECKEYVRSNGGKIELVSIVALAK